MPLAILFYFLYTQHVSGITMPIIRSLQPPTRCHLLFYFTSYILNMFRELLCLSSGVCDHQLDATCYFILLLIYSTCFGHYYAHHQEFATMFLNYHIGRFVLGLLCVGGWVRFGCSSIRAASHL